MYFVFPSAQPTSILYLWTTSDSFSLTNMDTSDSFEETTDFVLPPPPYYFVPPTKASPYYVCATLCMLIRSALDQLGQGKQMHRKQTLGRIHDHPVCAV